MNDRKDTGNVGVLEAAENVQRRLVEMFLLDGHVGVALEKFRNLLRVWSHAGVMKFCVGHSFAACRELFVLRANRKREVVSDEKRTGTRFDVEVSGALRASFSDLNDFIESAR